MFEKLFGDSGSTERGAREARMRQHKSMLDSINAKLASLKKELGPQDQVKVKSMSTPRRFAMWSDAFSARRNRAAWSYRRWSSR